MIESINFGIIDKNRYCELDTTITIYNHTNDSIRILRTDVSCECLTINYTDSVLLPNSDEQLNIHLDLSDIDGEFERRAYIKLSSLERVKVLLLKGKVE